jgi:hypothetical protein
MDEAETDGRIQRAWRNGGAKVLRRGGEARALAAADARR